MLTFLLILLAASLAPLTYFRLESRGHHTWMPMLLRAIAWGGLGALLANPGCPAAPGAQSPVVLLDGSLSMGSDTARQRAATDSARVLGTIRWFGDTRPWTDSVALRGRSDLAAALASAAALGRRTVVVTDGELDDLRAIPPDLAASTGIVLLPRVRGRDLAVVGVRAPARATVGDSLLIAADLRAYGTDSVESVAVEVRLGTRVLGRGRVELGAGASGSVRFPVTSRGVQAGTQILTVEIVGAEDREPRDDRRLVAVEFAATPGVVMLASPGDWDARFLFRTVREVADLPVKGFVQLESGEWNDMDGLARISDLTVRTAARGADLLILRGMAEPFAKGTGARGILRWPQAAPGSDEWYVADAPVSPVAMAFLGVPVDSMPPLFGARSLVPESGSWTGLTVQLGRRGAARPVLLGREGDGRREVAIGADGFWRWAFRGGPSGDAYRAMTASTIAWLLAASDSGASPARVVRTVVEQGMPIVFQRAGDSLAVLPVAFEAEGQVRTDTLRFGGDGRATAWLPPGTYRYRFDGRHGGTVAVDTWSREWLPQAVVVSSRPIPRVRSGERRTARQWPWLYALVLLSLAGEWFARRRLGLR